MRIGQCDIDLERREISVDGSPVGLSPRAWDVLGHLIRNRGRLVTNAELLAVYWGGRTSDETYVRKQIAEIRRALGDLGGASALLRTVRKRGYVLAADSRAESLPSVEARVAVLPFVNFSHDSDLTEFCDGLTEELLNKLARRADTAVIARTSAFQYRDRNMDVREIGRALEASHVLEGSVRRGRGMLCVTVQLIDGRTGLHCWSNGFDCVDSDDLTAQDEIATAIGDNVSELLGASGTTRTIILSDRFQEPGEFERLVRGIASSKGDFPGGD